MLRPRQTEQEEAAELAEQVYRNKTFLNIPFIAGSGENYIAFFEAAMKTLKAADPKAEKKKNLTPAQFKREAAKTKAESIAAGITPENPVKKQRQVKGQSKVLYGPQERPTALLLPELVVPMLLLPEEFVVPETPTALSPVLG